MKHPIVCRKGLYKTETDPKWNAYFRAPRVEAWWQDGNMGSTAKNELSLSQYGYLGNRETKRNLARFKLPFAACKGMIKVQLVLIFWVQGGHRFTCNDLKTQPTREYFSLTGEVQYSPYLDHVEDRGDEEQMSRHYFFSHHLLLYHWLGFGCRDAKNRCGAQVLGTGREMLCLFSLRVKFHAHRAHRWSLLAGPIKSEAEDHGREPVGESVPLSFPSLDGRGQGEGGKGIAYHLSATGVSPWVSTY